MDISHPFPPRYTVQGRDINLDIKRVVGYRSFCNKLWNAVRFMLGCFDGYAAAETIWADLAAARGKLAGRDKFVLSKLHGMVAAADEHLTGYCFGDCVQAIYAFFLNDLCDVYVELVKPVVYGDDKTSDPTLAKMALWCCLDAGLRCLHVMCPFVTEELWQRLPRTFGVSSIMVAPYARIASGSSPIRKRLMSRSCTAMSQKMPPPPLTYSMGGGAGSREHSFTMICSFIRSRTDDRGERDVEKEVASVAAVVVRRLLCFTFFQHTNQSTKKTLNSFDQTP